MVIWYWQLRHIMPDHTVYYVGYQNKVVKMLAVIEELQLLLLVKDAK